MHSRFAWARRIGGALIFVVAAGAAAGASACGKSDAPATCAEAFDHMAGLSVDRTASALPESQRDRHQQLRARVMRRDPNTPCSNDNPALIACVLDARDLGAAQRCWRTQ